jgi:hypothetical protein
MKAEEFNGKNGKGWPAKTKENTTWSLPIHKMTWIAQAL